MAISPFPESMINIIDLVNEINLLLKDYKHVHGAPKQVIESQTEIEYIADTASYLETLFGDENHLLHLSEPAKERFREIKVVLKVDLRALHHILQKWPDPPTFTAMMTFGALHNNQVKDLRRKFIKHQLELTMFLAEATAPASEEDFADGFSPLGLGPKDCADEVDAEVSQNRETFLPVHSEDIEYREETNTHPVWDELLDLLLTLPPTMRLSHLVQTLQHMHKITTSSAFPKFSVFDSDVEGLLKLAKQLDERLLSENRFSRDVLRELHTAIDLEIKFLLHELTLLGTLMKQGLFHPHHAYVSINYNTLPIHSFLQDHRVAFMMILTLAAGSRLSQKDPSHQDGTRRDEEFEAAVAAVMASLARHSSKVNGWCEGRRASVNGAVVKEVESNEGVGSR